MTYDQNTPAPLPVDDTDSGATTEPVVVAEPLYQTAQTVTVMDNVMIGAAEIKTAWNKQVSSIIETGNLLLKWNKILSGTSKFKKLFDPDIGGVPFSYETATQLMKIARHPVLSNVVHGQQLPPSWRTLIVLSRAPVKKLEQWLADKEITPATERSRADELVGTKAKVKTKAKKDSAASAATESNTSESDAT